MILKLVYYGDPRLRARCSEVERIGDEEHKFIADLKESVLHYNGAGLAACQVGSMRRILVVCFQNGENAKGLPKISPPKVYINPTLDRLSSREAVEYEGCLSIPGIEANVKRPYSCTVHFLDEEGKACQEDLFGWRARVIFHELDHLNGVLFVDRIDPQDRGAIEQALRTLKRQNRSSHA